MNLTQVAPLENNITYIDDRYTRYSTDKYIYKREEGKIETVKST